MNQNISLTSLSEILNTNTTYLSAIINHHYGMNFKSLMHKYRIEEARKLLISNDSVNYSLEGIAFKVGYKSRSIFHQSFKEITGVTPAVYSRTFKKAESEYHKV
jgi:YesN/AraC family two-component response regulator